MYFVDDNPETLSLLAERVATATGGKSEVLLPGDIEDDDTLTQYLIE